MCKCFQRHCLPLYFAFYSIALYAILCVNNVARKTGLRNKEHYQLYQLCLYVLNCSVKQETLLRILSKTKLRLNYQRIFKHCMTHSLIIRATFMSMLCVLIKKIWIIISALLYSLISSDN